MGFKAFLSIAAAALLLVPGAAAHTGGLPAGEPLELSPAGGLEGPEGSALAQAAEAAPAGEPVASAAVEPAPTQPADAVQADEEEAGTSSAPEPIATAEPTAAALPDTGLGLFGIVCMGVGLLLLGFALRLPVSYD